MEIFSPTHHPPRGTEAHATSLVTAFALMCKHSSLCCFCCAIFDTYILLSIFDWIDVYNFYLENTIVEILFPWSFPFTHASVVLGKHKPRSFVHVLTFQKERCVRFKLQTASAYPSVWQTLLPRSTPQQTPCLPVSLFCLEGRQF